MHQGESKFPFKNELKIAPLASRSLLLLSYLILNGNLSLAKNNALPAASNGTASSVKLYGGVNELLSACANAGVEITSTTLPAKIIKVRMGSPAFYAGLADNDTILKGSLANNRLKITFRRGVMVYAVELATQAGATDNAASAAGTRATTLQSAAATTKLSGGAEKDPVWTKLKHYDIVILIDQSGSMNEAVDGSGLTKWEWCSNQLTSFASQSLARTGKTFTIGTFNGTYNIRRNCSPIEVQDTFVRNKPAGATELAQPLKSVLSDYINGPRKDPLLVVVLTDGMPAEPEQVESCIVDITKRISSPDQIQLDFFEIGNDPDGQALLTILDAGLEREGARYDIVDCASFEQLKHMGLKEALYAAFDHNLPPGMNQSSENGLQSQLDQVRKQLQEAKARSSQRGTNK